MKFSIQGIAAFGLGIPPREDLSVQLSQEAMRRRPAITLGMYLPFGVIVNSDALEAFKDLLLQSGANTLIVDIKNEWGFTHIPFEHKLNPSFTLHPESPSDLEELIEWCNRKEIYLIGRQVVMPDWKLLSVYPYLGLADKSGGLWSDIGGKPWVNPCRAEIGEYNAAIAAAAATMGFNEIQYDYIRFPSDDNPTSHIRYKTPSNFSTRTNAVASILEAGRQAVHAAGALLAVDVFGYSVWENVGDMGIGQHIETIGEHVDVLSPMAYPSLYGSGVQGTVECPNGCFPGSAYPYEILNSTVRNAQERLSKSNPSAIVVPWFQAYPDTRYGQRMDLAELEAQQRGALAAGAGGALAWNPSLKYDPNTFRWIKIRDEHHHHLIAGLRRFGQIP